MLETRRRCGPKGQGGGKSSFIAAEQLNKQALYQRAVGFRLNTLPVNLMRDIAQATVLRYAFEGLLLRAETDTDITDREPNTAKKSPTSKGCFSWAPPITHWPGCNSCPKSCKRRARIAKI